MVAKVKKYLINFNGANYNFKTRSYETKDGRNMSYEDASKYKWKCEKCPETFTNYELLKDHKNQVHSY
jgi:transcriptional regulator NrdR family protein